MFWSQHSLVLVAVASAVFFSAFIAARSSYKGKLKKYRRRVLLFDIVKTILLC